MKKMNAIVFLVVCAVLLVGCGSAVKEGQLSSLDVSERTGIPSEEDEVAKALIESWIMEEKALISAKEKEIGYLTAGEFFGTKQKLNVTATLLNIEERLAYNDDDHISEFMARLEERINTIAPAEISGLADALNKPETYYNDAFREGFDQLNEKLNIASPENKLRQFFNLDITDLTGEELYEESQSHHASFVFFVEPQLEAIEKSYEQFGSFFTEAQQSKLDLAITSLRNSYEKQSYFLDNISELESDSTELEESVDYFKVALAVMEELNGEFP